MSNRPNVHYHRHQSGPGAGGSIVVGLFSFVLQVALMILQLTIWLIPKVLDALAWTARYVVAPCVRGLAEFTVRAAAKASDAYRNRPKKRSGSDRGWRS